MNMITLQKALDIAFEYCTEAETEKIRIETSLGRILAEDVFSDTDMPPFTKSAMDGYACRREDLKNELTLLEIIPAGISPTQNIAKNTCSKIMTGAEVPKGADTVIMVEQTRETGPGKIVFTGENTPSNICSQGEDLKKGSLILRQGTLVRTQHIAMLAAAGKTEPLVFRQPRAGIITTGSELIEPGQQPAGSKIRNSNGPQLVAQFENLGLKTKYYGIVSDHPDHTRNTLEKSVQENDLTVISGGVSVGDFDFVPNVIRELGFTIHFNRLSVKPGQHTTFAVNMNSENQYRYIIGLPGNPVSSFIQFELFVKPFLFRLQGTMLKQSSFPMVLAEKITRKKADKTEFLPVRINSQNQAEPVKYNGSAHIHAYGEADGFITVEMGVSGLEKGGTVYVRPI